MSVAELGGASCRSLVDEIHEASRAPWFDGSDDEWDAGRLRLLLRRARQELIELSAPTRDEIVDDALHAIGLLVVETRDMLRKKHHDLVINDWRDPMRSSVVHWLQPGTLVTICGHSVEDEENPGELKHWWVYADLYSERHAQSKECSHCLNRRLKAGERG